jgi:hypothetical protein
MEIGFAIVIFLLLCILRRVGTAVYSIEDLAWELEIERDKREGKHREDNVFEQMKWLKARKAKHKRYW